MSERAQRRLSAIVSTDIVGYSRLLGADEADTLARMKAHRRELWTPMTEKYGGRVVGTAGDSLLIEFGSAVSAVESSIEVQQGMAAREAVQPEDRKMLLRIGVNIGEVVVEGDDILGDGVNVAARLQAMAAPGGICISGKVYDEVAGKLSASFSDSGEHEVKNIARPIRVWRWQEEESAAPSPIPSEGRLSLPDKPSIAVLPFANMSGDPEQEYLADGLAEDIITDLSKVSEMFVISRNSTFAYKGKSPDVRQVAKELGVRNVLEGSVRRSGNRIRITAQLIDAKSGSHLWAERYDRELTDVFALQDEITQEIVTTLQVNLTEGQQARLRRRQTSSVAAWESCVRGVSDIRHFTRESNAAAREKLERAIELDPDFAAAWTFLGWTYMVGARTGWDESPTDSVDRSASCVEKSLALDPSNPEAYALIGSVQVVQRQYDAAVASGEKALALGPNIAESYVLLGQTLNYTGRAEDGTAMIEKAMRLSPFYPDNWLGILANGYRLLGRYEEAIALDQERLRRNPDNFFSDFRLAALYMELGNEKRAHAHAREALKKNPNLTLSQIRFCEPYRDEQYLKYYLDLLRRAGLPE